MDDARADLLQRVLNQLMLPRNRNRLCAPVIASAPTDLDSQSYFLLTALGRSGPVSSAQAADVIGIDRSGTSRYADRLEAKGLLERVPDPGDQRARLLALTPAGRRLVTRLNGVLADHVGQLLGPWPTEKVDVLIEGISILLGEEPAPGSEPKSGPLPGE